MLACFSACNSKKYSDISLALTPSEKYYKHDVVEHSNLSIIPPIGFQIPIANVVDLAGDNFNFKKKCFVISLSIHWSVG